MSNLPPSLLKRTMFIEELSVLIGKAPTTIRTCATNRKFHHLIPRPFKMPHSRRLVWYEEDVVAWLEGSQTVTPVLVRRRGRPTKLEQVQRASMKADEIGK